MPDPFSALSIAAAIIQIIDVGLGVVSAAHQIHRTGSTINTSDLKSVADDIKNLNDVLQSNLGPPTSTGPTHDNDESVGSSLSINKAFVALQNIASETSDIATQLTEALQRLECKNDEKTWNSLRKALKTVWSKSKVDEIAKRLDLFRSELVLRIVVSLKLDERFQAARQDERFNHLDRKTKEVADILLNNKNFFTNGIQSAQQAILAQQDMENSKAQKRHEETIAAIATLRGFSSPSLDGVNWPSSIFSDQPQSLSLCELHEIQNEILDYLAFERMRDRRDDISPNYKPTFQWVYDGANDGNWPTTNFGEWLRNGSGCYWVSGKAGSGKSTLMRYISEEPRTRSLLSTWAAKKPLMCASFYFWNAGTPLQKSHTGLLQSILHDALSQYPQLIPIVFPGLCRAVTRDMLDASKPTFAEMKKAFCILTTQKVFPLEICLFIDGIDEYAGDPMELVKLFFEDLTPAFKVVVSSRPTPACVEAFSSFPSLKLHELTKKDINIYVHEKFMDHPRMKDLQTQDSRGIDRLASEIVNKASGVFLWVVLVVKSLLTGFTNYDDFEVLQKRLEALPEELPSLYKHMLDNMEPIYRVEASKLLQIMYKNSQIPTSLPLTLLRLSLADEINPEAAIDIGIEMMSTEKMLRRCIGMQTRVLSHCCGLLEVHTSESKASTATEKEADGANFQKTSETVRNGLYRGGVQLAGHPYERYRPMEDWEGYAKNVFLSFRRRFQERPTTPEHIRILLSEAHFLHKSVIDFIGTPEIWSSLTMLTAPLHFDANISLASSSLLEIKMAPVEYDRQIEESSIWGSLLRGLIECAGSETSTGEVQHLLMNEFDTVMDWHWRKICGWMPRYGASFNDKGHWSNLVPFRNWPDEWPYGGPQYSSIFSLACRFGMKTFVKEMLEQDKDNNNSTLMESQHVRPETRPSLAQTALQHLICNVPNPSETFLTWHNETAIIKLSLQYGADPNMAFYEGRSPWQIALWRCTLSSLDLAERWTELLELLIRSGADPYAPYLIDTYLCDYYPRGEIHMGDYCIRFWQSTLSALRDKFKEGVRNARSKTMVHKINRLWERLQKLILTKGGVYREWIEEEKSVWDKDTPEDRWVAVTNPVHQESIIQYIKETWPDRDDLRFDPINTEGRTKT